MEEQTCHSQRERRQLQVYIDVLKAFFNENKVQRHIFQDDNAPAHRSTRVKQFHSQRGTRQLNWHAMSPDLNPIEHVWDTLGRQLRTEQHSIAELEIALQRKWSEMPQYYIDHLIDSMSRRVRAVIENKGGHTRY